jgi:hypothetical protein
VSLIGTSCESVSITSIVSKWRPFSFILNRGNRERWLVGDDSHFFYRQSLGRSFRTFSCCRRNASWREKSLILKRRGGIRGNCWNVVKGEEELPTRPWRPIGLWDVKDPTLSR